MSKVSKNRFDPGNGQLSYASSERGISGRRFVLGAIASMLVGTAAVQALFRAWRRKFQARMELGNREVVASVEPLAAIIPNDRPDLDPKTWKTTVEQAQAMLRSVVASNMLDDTALLALGADLRSQVARARPETVRALLSKIWDDIIRKAGPNIAKRHAKPALLEPRKTGSPLP